MIFFPAVFFVHLPKILIGFLFVLQPQNLVISGPLPGSRVKLCDFGLSRKLSNATEVC